MDLLRLDRKSLALEFIRDGRQVIDAVQQWFAFLSNRHDENNRDRRLIETLRQIDDAIEIAAYAGSQVAARYKNDMNSNRVQPIQLGIKYFSEWGWDSEFGDWVDETEAYLNFLADFIEVTSPTKKPTKKPTKQPSKLNEQRLLFYDAMTAETPGITIPEVASLWNKKHKLQVDDSAFSTSLYRAKKARNAAKE